MQTQNKSKFELFCKKWGKTSANEIEEELISIFSDLQKDYIMAGIKNREVSGKNLYSEYKKITSELTDLKTQITGIREFLVTKDKRKPKASKEELGNFSTKEARKFAEENGIEESALVGTSKTGKITKIDIKKAIKGPKKVTTKSNKKSTGIKKICQGITANADPCKSSGSINIQGSWYCKKHQNQVSKSKSLIEDTYSEYNEEDDELLDVNKLVNESKNIEEDDIEDDDIEDDDDKVDYE